MKFFILFSGLLSLLFVNHGEVKKTSNYRNFSIENQTCQFESGHAGSPWNYEKNESNTFELSNKDLSQSKKRLTGDNRVFSNNPAKNFIKHSSFLPIPNSKTNLFLIFHFSLSLWQVFLQ